MKIPMPEPKVSRSGFVSLRGEVVGWVDKGARGEWRASVSTCRRKDGRAFKAGGMRTRAQAVRWVVIHSIDWRTF